MFFFSFCALFMLFQGFQVSLKLLFLAQNETFLSLKRRFELLQFKFNQYTQLLRNFELGNSCLQLLDQLRIGLMPLVAHLLKKVKLTL